MLIPVSDYGQLPPLIFDYILNLSSQKREKVIEVYNEEIGYKLIIFYPPTQNRFESSYRMTRRYNLDGLLHSYLDLPATSTSSQRSWYKEGKLHRDNDLPATIRGKSSYWFKEDKLHRLAGPALILPSQKQYFIEGNRVTGVTFRNLKNIRKTKNIKLICKYLLSSDSTEREMAARRYEELNKVE